MLRLLAKNCVLNYNRQQKDLFLSWRNKLSLNLFCVFLQSFVVSFSKDVREYATG